MSSDYDLESVREILGEDDIKESTRKGYLKTWQRWLKWCEEQPLQPETVYRADIDRFLEEIPPKSQPAVRHQISAIYSRLRGEHDNPAIRLRPITPQGRRVQGYAWSRWTYWCSRLPTNPLPADPRQLANYLEEVCSKKSLSTAKRALDAISRAHMENDLPDPGKAEPVIQTMDSLKQRSDDTVRPARGHSELSPRSVESIGFYWEKWLRWCLEQDIDMADASPEEIVIYITFEYCTCTPSTITHVVHALNRGYQTSGLGHNPVASDEVRAAVKAIKRAYTPPADRVDPGTSEDENAGFAALDSLLALADSTRQTRRRDWRGWSQWCATHHIDPLDASPHHIASYLIYEAEEGLKVNTLQQRWQAIIQVYDVTDPDNANPARHLMVKQTMKGIRRQKRGEDAQMTAITDENLARIEATARHARPWENERQALVRGTTDLAIIGVMRDGLLRVSEAAALTWDDLEQEEDGTGRLTIRHSKTDQVGEGFVAYVSHQTMEWLMEMREMVMEGPTIFNMVKETIRRHIANAARHAGLKGRFGGHSLRIGMAQDLANDGAELPELMQVGRWKSPEMPARYIRKTLAGRNAVAKWYYRHPGRALID